MRAPLLRSAGLVATLAAGLTAFAFACEGPQSYVYSAQRYDPAADCLAAYAPVEVVNGEGASSMCPSMCMTVGDALYVSSMCPPLPSVATAVPADAVECIAALAAARRDTRTCDELADSDDASAGADGATNDASGDPTKDGGPNDASPADAADATTPITDAADAG